MVSHLNPERAPATVARPAHSPVPFNPQPLEQLRARLPAALVSVDQWNNWPPGEAIPVEEVVRHSFHFKTGMRLVVSLEQEGVLVSAQAEPGTPLDTLTDIGKRGLLQGWMNLLVALGGHLTSLLLTVLPAQVVLMCPDRVSVLIGRAHLEGLGIIPPPRDSEPPPAEGKAGS